MNQMLQIIPNAPVSSPSSFDSVFPQWKVRLSLPLLLRHPTSLLLGQPAPHRPCLLGSQVEGKVFFVFIVETELIALICVDDCQDSGDGFADVVAVQIPVSVSVFYAIQTFRDPKAECCN